MQGLGRAFNVLPVADDVYVRMTDCTAIAFVGVNTAGDTWTLTEAKDASGTGAQVLSTITQYFTAATVGAAWVSQTQAVGSAVTTTSSQDVVVIQVDAAELSDTFDYIKVASTSTGTVFAIQYDLTNPRKPANIAALV